MNIQRIEYFFQAAKHLNFRKAAEELHISHQALSKQIQLLEQEIGAKLFERSTKKITLTEVGKETIAVFEPVLAEIKHCEKRLKFFVESKKYTLKLGYFNGLSYKRGVNPIVQYLEQKYTGLQIDLLAVDVWNVVRFLQENQIDIIVSFNTNPKEWEGMECIVLAEEPLKIVVSNNHPWYEKERIAGADLRNEKMLVFSNRPISGADAFLPEIKVKERISVKNMDTYMGMLERGSGFGIISDLHVRVEGEFKLFPLPESYEASMQLVIAYKKEHPAAGKIQTLKDMKWVF